MRTRTVKRSKNSGMAASRTAVWAVIVGLGLMLAGSTSAMAQCVPPDCNDGNFCTIDICSAGLLCFNNERDCQDGSFCNGVETCDGVRELCAVACLGGGTCTGGLCVGGTNAGAACDPTITPINCPGGTMCSEDLFACVECLGDSDCGDPLKPSCNPSSGACVACYQNSQCDNGLLCDGAETCNATTNVCESGSPVQCDIFANPPEFCSEIFGGSCVQCETATDCAGGTFCSPKSCSAGTCINATPTDCKRCKDVNNNEAGPCEDNTDCDAGFTCTGSSSFCSDIAGRCVECVQDGNCEDLNFCTRNECSKLDYTCQFPSDGSTLCAELNGFAFCDGPELCVNQIGTCDPFTGAGCCQPGTPPVVDDGIPCTIDSCDEQNDVVVHQQDDTLCDDTLYCTGVETCDPNNVASNVNGCVSSPDIDCSFLDANCRVALCDDVVDSCVSNPDSGVDGTTCSDPSSCEAVNLCEAGDCVPFPPDAGDPYRCVVMELQPQGAGPYNVGDTISVDLIARADGCVNTSGTCAATEHPILSVNAILTWDFDKLKLRDAALGNPNPLDPCDAFDSCFVCPANQYNWGQSGFLFDCGTSGFNEPCVATGPTNDGDAFYSCFDQLPNPICEGGTAPPPKACVTTSGLHVTTFEFEVLQAASGTTSKVAFGGCAIEVPGARTKVSSRLPAPSPLTGDVTNRLVDATIVVAACSQDSQCSDGDPCTQDKCSTQGTCSNPPLCPTHPDPCIVRTCNAALGVCDNVPVACGANEECFGGDCFTACETVVDCDDGIACTTDTCDLVIPADGQPVDICFHATDDALCDTGLFCSQQRCDVDLGCVLAYDCVSTTGNPCPNQATCDDVADDCGGCLSPTVQGVGSRYLAITPQDQGATPLALLVEGACGAADVACVSSYVQSVCVGGTNDSQTCQSDADCPKLCELGVNHLQPCTFDVDCSDGGGTCEGACGGLTLGATPSFHPASFWGEARVGGIDIHPSTSYEVRTVCNFGAGQVSSAAGVGTTYKWGDSNGDTLVNVTDIVGVIDVVKQVLILPIEFEGANMWPCELDSRANVTDITVTVDAVKGFGYPCASSCP